MSLPLLQTKLAIPPPRLHQISCSPVTAKLRAALLCPATLIAAAPIYAAMILAFNPSHYHPHRFVTGAGVLARLRPVD